LTPCLFASLAVADAPTGLPVVLAAPEQVRPYRFFGGQTVRVPVLMLGASAATALRAHLVQLAFDLSAPVGPPVEVALPAAASNGAARPAEIVIALPEVQRETAFELRVHARSRSGGEWRPAGRLALRIFPPDLLAPLRAWADKHPLRVREDTGGLEQFLRDRNVRTMPAPGVESRGGLSLRAGRFARQPASSPRAGETVVLFMEKHSEVPRIVVEQTGPGTVVRVEGRLLGDLASDPLAQRTLLEVLELALGRESSTGGETP
jgi:hypothetical protein